MLTAATHVVREPFVDVGHRAPSRSASPDGSTPRPCPKVDKNRLMRRPAMAAKGPVGHDGNSLGAIQVGSGGYHGRPSGSTARRPLTLLECKNSSSSGASGSVNVCGSQAST